MASAAAGLKAEDLQAFGHAAAGHAGVLSYATGGLVIKPCTPAEIAFYESVSSHPEFQELIPAFLGTLNQGSPDETIPVSNRDRLIVLENLTHGFTRPCVIDIKLGARLWDDNTPEDKRKRLDAVAAKTTTGSLGLRIAGMSVWKEDKGEFVAYDKFYGRTFDKDTVAEGIKEYFSSGISEERQKMLAKRFHNKIKKIVEVIEKQESRMYSMSILAVYEGGAKELEEALKEEELEAKKPPRAEDDDEEEDDDDDAVKHKVESLKLIDFAHAFWTPGEGPDENVLQGVRNSQKLFAEFAGLQ